ncbi:hypothetical protein HPB52_002113 [Rhipicephalus sanguineus]|uniref:Uncharacterized protein n=1 Tax=Rhipicephalus sanguineus TaxID=34632 RepID=A0A9D4QBS9_RHISA|nr:hypothetical protein HPB52_002113 [Rhipicephalus sanguineus]
MEGPETRHLGGSTGGLSDGVPPPPPMYVPLLEMRGGARTRAGPAAPVYSVPVAVPITKAPLDGQLGHELKARGCLTWSPESSPVQDEHRPKSFYDTDGPTGYSYDIIPDIVHLVRYNQKEISFIDVISFRSIYINHRPKKIYVHCSPCGFTGAYTRLLEGINFTFIATTFPKEIFNISIQERYHSTDVVRLRALMRYGGIYADRDVFVVQSLRRYLRYEATISCHPDGVFGNMLMIFHKNSRFLRLYYDTYHQLNDSIWYYNAGVVPTEALVHPHPHLVNHVRYGLETEVDMLHTLYEPHAYPHWRSAYAVHTLYFHRWESKHDPLHNAELNETTIRDLDTAMGEMARSVIFGTSDFVPPDAPVLSVAALAARKDRGENLTRIRSGNERSFFQPVLRQAK